MTAAPEETAPVPRAVTAALAAVPSWSATAATAATPGVAHLTAARAPAVPAGCWVRTG
ncbi:hypothetical protein ACQKBZ_08980 [Mycobacterium tuberculosis]|uniref:hypothetical protein n=1 Tax=Mycobacterium tuberculosis TaxID=1773 RepID=UPI0001E6223E|nr:hypothetical protein [Mycobacterium tuberculosis]EFP19570.1 hypothetical protein TMCG_02855 [Mycobacterium tuberculosis SUMu003]EFP38694.1 hypothetical protein TMHG_00989 [Mycobacterium tuberculosis SUMu008]